jgi:phosphoglycerate dehydrogenase-like enzyme
MPKLTLLVLAPPNARYLSLLDRLPEDTHIVVGNQIDIFKEAGPKADAILSCINPGLPLELVWNLAPNVKWVHSMSAGIEWILFPALVSSPVPLTNGRGVFARSLGEFALTSMLFFAKRVREMLANQAAGKWVDLTIEEIHGKTVGVVGYGELGRASAVRAHALGAKIHALRRRPELNADDPIVEKSFSMEQRLEMLAGCDFVVCAAPLTPQTHGLIGETELRAMKKTAVIINIGRGPVIVEAALIQALQEGWIRGASLDVFDVEPLPEGHAFYSLENVLLSPHCADHTPTWTEDAMEFFLQNFERFRGGQPLLNVADKQQGY